MNKIHRRKRLCIFDSAQLNEELNMSLELEFSSEFSKQLSFLLKQGDVIVPTVNSKHSLDIKQLTDSIYVINNITKELDSFIGILGEKHELISMVTPTNKNPLTHSELC